MTQRSSIGFAVLLAGALTAAAAGGQETMKFEPVSPESAAALERRTARANETTIGRPAAPEPPTPPSRPETTHGGDVVRIGSDIHVEQGQVVEGDVFALRGDIRVDGHVKGDVATTGGDVHLGSTARVDGDVMCIGGELIEDPGAIVSGQRVTALRGSMRNRVARRVRERIKERDWERQGHDGEEGAAFAFSWLLLSTLAAWLAVKFAPNRSAVALESLRRSPGASLGVGFLLLLLLGPSGVALALVMAILCITIIGIPLAILLAPAYVLVLTMLIAWGFVLGAVTVGERMQGRWPNLAAGAPTVGRSAVLGALGVSGLLFVSSILHFIPIFRWISTLLWVIGWVTFGFLTMSGAGALLRSKFGAGPEGRWWPPFPRPATAPSYPSTPAPPAATAAPPPPPPPVAPPEPS